MNINKKNLIIGGVSIIIAMMLFATARYFHNRSKIKPIQTVKLVITNARTEEEFCDKVTKDLDITSADLLSEILLCDMQDTSFDRVNTIFFYVVPNTYEVYKNISAKGLLDKLKKETDKFFQSNGFAEDTNGWVIHDENISLTRNEVMILASIVSEETNKTDEMPRIAGVYINRLKKDMLLQADPTIRFAVGDFTIKRVAGEHLKVQSAFNTYINKGLPPSPICIAQIPAIKAVLNYEHHNYLYFCAREDFSGYHNFASDFSGHVANANRYRRAAFNNQ